VEVLRQPHIHDVIVIGSGASGGMAAWNLTRQGLNVLMLDAGERFNRADFLTHVTPHEWRDRMRRGGRPPQFFLNEKEQPLLTPPGQPYRLLRVWGHGGKTKVWGRVSLRARISTSGQRNMMDGKFLGRSVTTTSLPII